MQVAVHHQGRLVGFVEDHSVDHFWVYGRWLSVTGADAASFVRAVGAGEEPEVELHGSAETNAPSPVPAYAMNLSDGIIEVRMIPTASESG